VAKKAKVLAGNGKLGRAGSRGTSMDDDIKTEERGKATGKNKGAWGKNSVKGMSEGVEGW